MVPNGWELKRLEELCSPDAPITYGVLKPGDFYQDGIPLLQIKDLRDGEVITNDLHLISPALDEEYRRSRILKDDILISLVGTIGRIAKYRSAADANIHRNIGRIRSEIHEYLYHFLTSSRAQNEIGGSSSGSSQSALNLSTLRSMKIPVPPFPEQKKIAQILSTWDKAITTTEQLLANSQQQKKALMQQLLTGKKRLLAKNGVRFRGEWKSYHLSHVTVIVMGSSPKSEAYNENGIGLPLLQGNADIKNRISAPRVFTSEITKECEIGDILLSVRAPVGTVAISEHKACIGRGIAALHAKPNFDQSFIYQFLLWFEPKWGSLSQGSTFESINSDDIKNLKIKVPNFGEQQKIAAVLSTADQEISALQQKLDALKQEKSALMQQLLTGKRRVKVDDKEIA